MRATEGFDRSTLSPDDVHRIIDAAAEKGVQAISFTGGEPMLLLPRLAGYIRRAGAAGIPYIRTGTNGYFFAGCDRPDRLDRVRAIADALADTPLRNFWISLDSADPAVHEQMRGFPGVVAGMERALPEFHARGLFPSVNLGVNRNLTAATMAAGPVTGDRERAERFYRHFREAFRTFYRRVVNMGFTIVNSCYPMSVEPDDALSAVYAATAVDGVVRFSSAEKAALFRALMDTIPEFRSRIRIFSPRASLQALVRHYGEDDGAGAYSCRGGIDFFFVDARDGGTYPCGYRGDENLGPFWEVDVDAIDATPFCQACDWECFRDPSELFGPLLESMSAPIKTARKLIGDAAFRRLWADDLRYYRACDLFDGRRPPNMEKLSRF
jgi:MoaA/NifB/PqqE/SkfB family radical SAM enzyme